MNIGEQIPDFTLVATGGLQAKLSDFRGQWLILYFYPKDATPGCTTEGQNFRDAHAEFTALNSVIFGISRDSITSHDKFKCQQQFPFELISDRQEEICKLFAVIKSKNMYGKTVQGIERSTFIIDPQGILQYQWRNVKVNGHVQEVLAVLQKLQQA